MSRDGAYLLPKNFHFCVRIQTPVRVLGGAGREVCELWIRTATGHEIKARGRDDAETVSMTGQYDVACKIKNCGKTALLSRER
jgi:hypothetical protein